MSEKTILLKDADFVVRDYGTVERSASVVIRGNLIVDVGNREEFENKYTFDEVHDCHGRIVLPGLIDSHTHCNETIMRGLGHQLKFHNWVDNIILPIGAAMEAMEDRDQLYYCLAQLTAMELVASGSTSLLEHSVNFGKYHVIAIARGLSDFGIRGAVAKGAEDFSDLDRGHVGDLEREMKETQEYLEKWQAEKDELIQAWVGPSGIEGKTTGGCTGPLLTELKKLANAYGTHFHTHLAGNIWEVENIRKQKGFAGSVAFGERIGILDERTSLAHCIVISHGEDRILQDTGAKISHCPSCNQICALGVIPLVRLREQGTICGIGTDGAPQNDSLDMIREMRQAVLLQKIHFLDPDIMSHVDAFRMATESGAKILGIENLGKIQPGYLADITIVQVEGNLFLTPMYDPLDTLVYAGSGGRDVAMTMVNGRIVYKDGEFKTIDAEKVISKVEEAALKIREQLGF
ncbi:MAG: amidohydrolase [Deltaproteobacteria bacterium]|nr:amidohydrolase [Deltaproteobacteria bacterium]